MPFGLRVGVRRLPRVARDLVRRRSPRLDDPSVFGHTQAHRATPLRRQSTAYAPDVQRAKERNVQRAAELLDGLVLWPGEELSWHREVGPPLRARGFVPGPELHEDQLELGTGGGLCQAANLVFWLGVHAGLEVVERHRHGLDLFPDDARTAPFGSGATVFYPHRDLRLRNPHPWPVLLHLRVEGGQLVGEVRTRRDVGRRWELVERDHRFVEEAGVTWRENTLVRRVYDGPLLAGEEVLLHNRARVAYPRG